MPPAFGLPCLEGTWGCPSSPSAARSPGFQVRARVRSQLGLGEYSHCLHLSSMVRFMCALLCVGKVAGCGQDQRVPSAAVPVPVRSGVVRRGSVTGFVFRFVCFAQHCCLCDFWASLCRWSSVQVECSSWQRRFPSRGGVRRRGAVQAIFGPGAPEVAASAVVFQIGLHSRPASSTSAAVFCGHVRSWLLALIQIPCSSGAQILGSARAG
mmetsp:Transcript_438/g.886  ORF Transcript_438/g.886 Transcript_438/m.886 type:complete len:210 (-) Transcript_438:326-955(-)